MIDLIMVHHPVDDELTKVYFPDSILTQMGWYSNTPLILKPLYDGFGMVLYSNIKVKNTAAIYLDYKNYYVAPFVYVPDVIDIKYTLPVACSYIITSNSFPTKLNILFPSHIKATFNHDIYIQK